MAEEAKKYPTPQDNAKNKSVSSKFVDPCEDAAKASFNCLNRNDYVRDKCLDFFQAYRDCKKAWTEQRKEDGRAGRPTR